MLKAAKALWKTIRRLSGDDAYEQYLLHYQLHHQHYRHAESFVGDHALENELPPLSREVFFKQWQDKKWKGVKRCC